MANYNWSGAPNYGYNTWPNSGAAPQMPGHSTGYAAQPYYPTSTVPTAYVQQGQVPYTAYPGTAPIPPQPVQVPYQAPGSYQAPGPYQTPGPYQAPGHYPAPIQHHQHHHVPVSHPPIPPQPQPQQQPYIPDTETPYVRKQQAYTRNLKMVSVLTDSMKAWDDESDGQDGLDDYYYDNVSNSSRESRDGKSSRDRGQYRERGLAVDRTSEERDSRDQEIGARSGSRGRDSRDRDSRGRNSQERRREDRSRRDISRSPRRNSSRGRDTRRSREKSLSPDSCSDIFQRLAAYKQKFNAMKTTDNIEEKYQKQSTERKSSSGQAKEARDRGSETRSRNTETTSQQKNSRPQQKDNRPQQKDNRLQQKDNRPSQKDNRPSQKDNRPLQKDNRSSQKDNRPQHKDTRPQHKDTRPQQKDTRPQQKDTQSQQKDTRLQQKDNRPQQKDTQTRQKDTRPQEKDTKSQQKDSRPPPRESRPQEKKPTESKRNEARPQQNQTNQSRVTRSSRNQTKSQQQKTKPQQKETKPPETKEEFMKRKNEELQKRLDSTRAQIVAKRKASTEDTVASTGTPKKAKTDTDKSSANDNKATKVQIKMTVTDSSNRPKSDSAKTDSSKESDNSNKFVIPKVPPRNAHSPRKADRTNSPVSPNEKSRQHDKGSASRHSSRDTQHTRQDNQGRKDRETDRSSDRQESDKKDSKPRDDTKESDGKRKLTDDKSTDQHKDEKRRRYEDHSADSRSKTADQDRHKGNKSDNKTSESKNKVTVKSDDKRKVDEKCKESDKQGIKKESKESDKTASSSSWPSQKDSKEYDKSSSPSKGTSQTSSVVVKVEKRGETEIETKKKVVSKVDRSEIEEVLGMVFEDEEKEEKLTDKKDGYSSKSLPSGTHPRSEIDVRLRTIRGAVVGLQYIDELIQTNIPVRPNRFCNWYRCRLCGIITEPNSIFDHIEGRKHRQFFFKRNWPDILNTVNRRSPEANLEQKMVEASNLIENQFGRQKVTAVEITTFTGLKKRVIAWKQMIPDVDRRIKEGGGFTPVTTIQSDENPNQSPTGDTDKPHSSDHKETTEKSQPTKSIGSYPQTSDQSKMNVEQNSANESTGLQNSANEKTGGDVPDYEQPDVVEAISQAKSLSFKEGRPFVAFYRLIKDKLDVPLLGLDYVVELAGYTEGAPVRYLCELCKSPFIEGAQTMFDHIVAQPHLEHYLVQHHANLAKHFVNMKGEQIRTKIVLNQAKVAFSKDGRGQIRHTFLANKHTPVVADINTEEPGTPEKDSATAPGTEPEVKVKLFDIMANYEDVPFVGLGYITEIQNQDQMIKPCYECSLCNDSHAMKNIKNHLVSITHRLNFLKINYPLLHSKTGGDRQLVEKYAKEIEDRYGRDSVCVKTILSTRPSGMPVYSTPLFVKGPYSKKSPEEVSPKKQSDETAPSVSQTGSEVTQVATPSEAGVVNRGANSHTEFELLIEGLECTPFLGLQYITEVQHPSRTFPAKYECMLCHHIGNGTPLTTDNILNHISSRGHRLNFFRENHEHIYKEIISHRDRQEQTSALTQYTKEIDATMGRGVIAHTISSDLSYWANTGTNTDDVTKPATVSEDITKPPPPPPLQDLGPANQTATSESVPAKPDLPGTSTTPEQIEPTDANKTTKEEVWRPDRKHPAYYPTLKNNPKMPKYSPQMTSPVVKDALNFDFANLPWEADWEKFRRRVEAGEMIPSNMQSRFLTSYDQGFKTFPLLGLQWIVEIQRPNLGLEPYYLCRLCMTDVSWKLINNHLMLPRHRIMYIGQYFVEMYSKIRCTKFPVLSKLVVKLNRFSEEIKELEARQHDMPVYLELGTKQTGSTTVSSSAETGTTVTKTGYRQNKPHPLPVPESQKGLLAAVAEKMKPSIAESPNETQSSIPAVQQQTSSVTRSVGAQHKAGHSLLKDTGVEDVSDFEDVSDIEDVSDVSDIEDISDDEFDFDKPLTEEEMKKIEEEMVRKMDEDDDDLMDEFDDEDHEMFNVANKAATSDRVEVSISLETDVFRVASSHVEQPRSSGTIPGLTLIPDKLESKEEDDVDKSSNKNSAIKSIKTDKLKKVPETSSPSHKIQKKSTDDSVSAKLGKTKTSDMSSILITNSELNKTSKASKTKTDVGIKTSSKKMADETKASTSTDGVSLSSKKVVVVLKKLSKQQINDAMKKRFTSKQHNVGKDSKETSQTDSDMSVTVEVNDKTIDNVNKNKSVVKSSPKPSSVESKVHTKKPDDKGNSTEDHYKGGLVLSSSTLTSSSDKMKTTSELSRNDKDTTVHSQNKNASERDSKIGIEVSVELNTGATSSSSINVSGDETKSLNEKFEEDNAQPKSKTDIEKKEVNTGLEVNIELKEETKPEVEVSIELNEDNPESDEDFKAFIESQLGKDFVTVDEFEDEHQTEVSVTFRDDSKKTTSVEEKKVKEAKPTHRETNSKTTSKSKKNEDTKSKTKTGEKETNKIDSKTKRDGKTSKTQEIKPLNKESKSEKTIENKKQQQTRIEASSISMSSKTQSHKKDDSPTETPKPKKTMPEPFSSSAKTQKETKEPNKEISCKIVKTGSQKVKDNSGKTSQENKKSNVSSSNNNKTVKVAKEKVDPIVSQPNVVSCKSSNQGDDKTLSKSKQQTKSNIDDAQSKISGDTNTCKDVFERGLKEVNAKDVDKLKRTDVDIPVESEEIVDFESLVCVDEVEEDESTVAEAVDNENNDEFTSVDEVTGENVKLENDNNTQEENAIDKQETVVDKQEIVVDKQEIVIDKQEAKYKLKEKDSVRQESVIDEEITDIDKHDDDSCPKIDDENIPPEGDGTIPKEDDNESDEMDFEFTTVDEIEDEKEVEESESQEDNLDEFTVVDEIDDNTEDDQSAQDNNQTKVEGNESKDPTSRMRDKVIKFTDSKSSSSPSSKAMDKTEAANKGKAEKQAEKSKSTGTVQRPAPTADKQPKGSGSKGSSSGKEAEKASKSTGKHSTDSAKSRSASKDRSTSGDSAKARSSSKDSAKAKSASGDSTKARSTSGNNAKARSTSGDSAKAKSTSGDSAKGKSTSGDSAKAKSTSEDSAKAKSTSGDSTKARSASRDSAKAKSTSSDSAKSEATSSYKRSSSSPKSGRVRYKANSGRGSHEGGYRGRGGSVYRGRGGRVYRGRSGGIYRGRGQYRPYPDRRHSAIGRHTQYRQDEDVECEVSVELN